MKVSGRTRAEVVTKLKALQAEHDLGADPVAGYTVRQAIDDWLSDGLEGRSARTVQLNRDVAKPLVKALGNLELRKLTAQQVRRALNAMARDHSSRTIVLAHNALTRAIRYAEANRQIVHNVAALVDTPKGGLGRPSKALTAEQAAALLEAAQLARLGAYVVLCLMTGIRTEEARALRWENVDLDAGSIAVWRSVRLGGDTKTEKSRRTLGLPEAAVKALREHRRLRAEDRLLAGEIWQDCGLVFTTRLGTQMDAGNVRKQFKAICKAAGLGESWTPRELRTSFVSLMSWSGVPVEETARLAGTRVRGPLRSSTGRKSGQSLSEVRRSWIRSSADLLPPILCQGRFVGLSMAVQEAGVAIYLDVLWPGGAVVCLNAVTDG